MEGRERGVSERVPEDEHVERRRVVVLIVESEHVGNDLREVRRDRHEIDAHLLRNAGDVARELRPQRVVGRRRGDHLELSDELAVGTLEPGAGREDSFLALTLDGRSGLPRVAGIGQQVDRDLLALDTDPPGSSPA